jgi:GxxExxY protein
MPQKNQDDNLNSYVKSEYPYSETTGRIIAAARQVHKNLGPGFEEVFYQRALALELPGYDLEFSREVWIDVHYRDRVIGRKRVDFIINEVMVEIKAREAIEAVHVIQALSYLRVSSFPVGLLLNFGAKSLQIKRLIHTPEGNTDSLEN